MAPGRLRLGARIPLEASAPGRLADLAAAVEEGGFDALFVPDDPGEVLASDVALEAYTALGALAVQSRTVRLGALATALPGRPPSIVAKQVTTLDHLSGGRALLGLRVLERGRAGRAALVEAVGVCRALATGEVVRTRGRHHRLEDAVNRPAPLQSGGPPVVVDLGELRPGDGLLLASAARLADVLVMAGAPAVVRRRCRLVAALSRLRLPPSTSRPDMAVLVPLAGADLVSEAPARGQAVTGAVERARASGADGVVLDFPAGVDPEALRWAGRAAAAAWPSARVRPGRRGGPPPVGPGPRRWSRW